MWYIIVFYIGGVIGYALSAMLSINKHTEELEAAYNKGFSDCADSVINVIDNKENKSM